MTGADANVPAGAAELASLASRMSGTVHEVTVKPAETPIDKQARIRREDRQFWASHFWTLVVVAGLAGVLVACFFNINHANAEIAQWARSSVLTLVSAGIAFVAGRISTGR